MPKIFDQARALMRMRYYSYKTEKTYVYWTRQYLFFHNLRHPKEMGAVEVEAFLTHLAVKRNVSTTSQNQALSALLFLYREVLKTDLPWLDGFTPAKHSKRIPVVLT